MRRFVTANDSWDAMSILKISRGHIKELFLDLAPDQQAELNELLEEALALRHAGAAHGGALGLHSVVQALAAMDQLLEVFEAEDSELRAVAEEARNVAAAPAGSLGKPIKVRAHFFCGLVMALALSHWERRMRPLVLLAKWGDKAGEGEPDSTAEDLDAQSMLKVIKGDPKHKTVEELRNKLSHGNSLEVPPLGTYFDSMASTLGGLEKKVLLLNAENKDRLCSRGYAFVGKDEDWSRLFDMCCLAASLGSAGSAVVELKHEAAADGLGRARVLRQPMFVGRENYIRHAASQLLDKDGGKFIIGGPPGVGKDATARQLLCRDDVARVSGFHPFMPFRLLGTTPGRFQDSLRRLAVSHLGATSDATKEQVFERVKDWLAGNADWLLYVEDCGAEAAKLLRDLLPPARHGRVLLTSNEKELALKSAGFARLDLEGFSMDEAMALLKDKMKLKKRIEEHAGEQGPEDLTPMLEHFIRDKLQLLPLLVSCVGCLMRSLGMSVKEVVEAHADLSPGELEAQGYDRVNGGHAPGLVGFVRLALRKLEERLGDAQTLSRARGLLAVLSVLPFEAPGRLFRYSAEELREAWAKCREEVR